MKQNIPSDQSYRKSLTADGDSQIFKNSIFFKKMSQPTRELSSDDFSIDRIGDSRCGQF